MVKYNKWDPARMNEIELRLSLALSVHSYEDLEMAFGKL